MTSTIRTAALLALALSAGPAAADAGFGSEVMLPEAVLLEVADLWAMGDRYEAAIEQIIATAALPEWNGGCGCDTDDAPAIERTPGM